MAGIDNIASLVKALEAGSYNAAPGSLVQGSALQVEDLSAVMHLTTFENKHLKLAKMLGSESCKSTLAQFDRQLSYGQFGGSAQLEGNVGQEQTSDFVRIVVPMCFYSHTRRVTLASTMVGTLDGKKSDERAAQDAALKVAADIEFDCFRGRADFSNAGVFDGNPAAMPGTMPNIIGADPGGSELLRCAGGFRFTTDSTLTSTTDATRTTAAALVISGGAGIGKRSFLGTIGSTFKGNVIAGVQDGTAAVSGQSGEVLSSTVTGVAAAATGAVGNVTSLALDPGDWLISAHATISGGATGLTSGSQQKLSVVTTSAANGTEGDTMQVNTILALSANGKHALSIPQLRVNISATTTIYLTSSVTYAAGSPTAAAKLIATRMR